MSQSDLLVMMSPLVHVILQEDFKQYLMDTPGTSMAYPLPHTNTCTYAVSR